MANPLAALQKLGQSPWHDNIRRQQLTSGSLRKMVKDGDITGLTSNPTIFERAIAGSDDYDETIARLARQGQGAAAIFDALSIEDIQAAAGVFAPVYERTGGGDGFVSIEVGPDYAHDTAATIKEAKRLWKAVDRPNVMVKIPATLEGLPAIEQCVADGLNINITLIFSLERYDAVIEAYLAGLERRRAAGKKISQIASVASFFVSRVDTLVDKLLDEKIRALGGEGAAGARPLAGLRGQAAIANARLAYEQFREWFGGARFAALARHGARLQRPLWASTSTKNPAYPDIYYVEALIGPDTVNTMPPATLQAYKDHGRPEVRIDRDLDQAAQVIEQLAEAGIHMDDVTHQLEVEGVASFAHSYDTLLAVVAARRAGVLESDRLKLRLPDGALRRAVVKAQDELAAADFIKRLWRKDSTLWKPGDAAHQAEIKIRLGWLDVFDQMQAHTAELTTFAGEVKRAGFTHALLCGMGGSSLAPEVLRETFGVAKGCLDLAVLDSTDPAAVLAAEARSNPARTLYIISSKSGSTTEPNAFFKYFWERVRALKGDRAGENFIAITDPNTSMVRTAAAHGFRRVFLNPPEIGGRYSALSYFGLAPAALMGIDVAQLLERAREMALACGPNVPAAQNAALALGTALGALARAGHDKLTLAASARLASFGDWVEQLIAESTGKEGVGILPVVGERLAGPPAYARGRDRVFADLRLDGRRDRALAELADAGQPVIELRLPDVYALGGEFLRWEIATAVAGWLLAIDPFDQPNVQESKDNTVRLLAAHAETGRLPDEGGALAPADGQFPLRFLRHLKSARRGDYIALTAYFERTPRRERLLRELQSAIRDRFQVATTVGYGPRFLHSTGQLHKGGANNGVFVQLTVTDMVDAPVPGERYTFSVLKQAQALGDYQALLAHQRRALRVDLGSNVEGGLREALGLVQVEDKPARGASASRRQTASRASNGKTRATQRTTR
ncbi:MAG: bifunctional transaldolase/phosoglucose isomerase [Anaerolineales bacterium]|nr:bifunctional transaldolase/phosoglucose isomerase [Anaerolineales bacterium]